MNMASSVIRLEWAADGVDGPTFRWRTVHTEMSIASEVSVVAIPDGAADLDDFLRDFLADPEIAELVPAASAELASEIERAGGTSLRTLRLSKGMSQTDLAAAIGSSQSRVSRLEAAREDATASVLRKIAAALDVDFNTLMDAMTRGDR